MTSLDVRNNSAVMKRAEQLKRWEESDTNREPPTPRPEKGRKIKFSSGCVFLAACMSGDKDEVIKLLDNGADINTANVDGLTALHQACIDDNLEMVEFLVEHDADINRQDNEGWTPLHATASCGFVSIARYLVEHGADVSAVNSDGDLAVDLANDIQHLPMIDFMQKIVVEHSIDCDRARQAEEQLMLADAKKWLRSDASEMDRPHPKTGATALHVAAAKGYTKVLSLLLAGRANVDKQDNDGWTPLHAAAHWGQKDSAEMLIDAMADTDIRNYAGQTCIDVAERKMVKFLEELSANSKRMKRRPSSQIRISDSIENHIDNTPTKIVRVEVRPDQIKEQSNEEKPNMATDTYKSQTADEHTAEEEAPWRRNTLARARTQQEAQNKNQVPEKDVSKINATTDTSDVILRRTQSFENDEKIPATSSTTLGTTSSTSTLSTETNTTTSSVSTMRSCPSPQNNNEANKNKGSNRDAASSPGATSAPDAAKQKMSAGNIIKNFFKSFVPPVRDEESETQRKAHAKRVRETRRSTQGVTLDEIKSAEELVKKQNSSTAVRNNNNNNNNNNSNSNSNVSSTTKSSSFKLEDASNETIFPPNNSIIIPSAPAVIAAANLLSASHRRMNTSPNTLNASNQSLNSIGRPVSAPAATSSGSANNGANNNDANATTDRNSDGFSYAARKANASTSTSSSTYGSTTAMNATTSATNTSITNTATATVIPTTATTTTSTITNATKDNSKDDKAADSGTTDNDKENENRSAHATQAIIQRRRKPKRRSTGVVFLDMDELDPERQYSANDADEKESGTERNPRSRGSSIVSASTTSSNVPTDDNKSRDKSENAAAIDYKALWEAAKSENDKLKQQLKKKDEEIVQTRATLERFANATTKNSLSEIEKRERRAMERKLSEMEEELKLLQKLKTENERLRAENRALTRVVSKLTTSAQNQLSKSK